MAATAVVLPEERVPRRSRAEVRLGQILASARVVYDRDGRDLFTMQNVALEADCSIGTIYRYFRDRVALLDAIAPNRDRAEEKLERVKKILSRPLPMVTASRERDRAALMLEALEELES